MKGQEYSFWCDKRVIVTGHTGFKGSWLTLWLHRMGARVVGVGLSPTTSPSLFDLVDLASACDSHFCDIRDRLTLESIMQEAQPEIVFHLAAQPIVRASYREPVETISTNVMGTTHVLDALRALDSVRVAVMVTTDKVYRNNEWHWPYREDDALGGDDPYSASKAASEIIIDSYRKSFLSKRGTAVASVRAGNVIGGGDWAEDRLIPDAIRAWQNGETLQIRRPEAIRPWQHVLDPLAGYLMLAQQLWFKPDLAGAYNFGPSTHDAATVRTVINLAQGIYGAGDVFFGDGAEGPREAGWLALEIAKSRQVLGFDPMLPLVEAVRRTVSWYQAQAQGGDARMLCENDIAAYEAML